MNEAQRQFVMGVAGVRLWYARAPLPGAAPSPEYDYGEPEVPAEVVADTMAAPRQSSGSPAPPSETSRQGLARLQGLLAGTDREKSDNSADPDTPPANDGGDERAEVTSGSTSPLSGRLSTEPSDAAMPAPVDDLSDELAGKAVAFHWRFWVGAQWLLVSSCPDSASRGLEDRLGGNILRALGDTVQRTESLRWPVFSNTAVPGNDAAGAREVIASVAEGTACPRQLWLGLESVSDSGAPVVPEALVAALGKATVSFPETLAALSSDPGAKRALWQALQASGRA